MKTRRRLWLWIGAGALAAGALALLAGCGGAGGPTWSSSGPSYGSSGYGPGYGGSGSYGSSQGRSGARQATGVVRGLVEVPARASGMRRPVAVLDWLRIGSPAHAEVAPGTARVPLVGARVHLVDRATRERVSATATTDSRGEFRIENVVPSPRFSAVATDGTVTLEAVLPAAEEGRQEVQVLLNEVTTVGAEAARLVEAEGLGPDAAAHVAQQVAELQAKQQAERPAEVPDLSRSSEVAERARQHLLRTADAAMAAALDAKEKADAWRAVAAGQLVARSRMKLSRKVRLLPLQVEALAIAAVGKDTRTQAAVRIAEALKKAGVKDKDGKLVTPEQVGEALAALQKPFPCLKDVKPDKVPVVAALLLAEQADAPFWISTREQMKAYLKELVGEVEEPREPAREKPAVAASERARGARPARTEPGRPSQARPTPPSPPAAQGDNLD